jgi:hypothetical protein
MLAYVRMAPSILSINDLGIFRTIIDESVARDGSH